MSNTPAAPVAPPPRAARRFESFAELSNFIFQIADRLRGKYKPSEYAKVILPLTVIRRFDCVLRDRRDAAREAYAKHLRRHPPAEAERRTLDELELPFVNTSPHDLESIRGETVRADLIDYLNGFSPAARDVLDHFRFHEQIDRLAKGWTSGRCSTSTRCGRPSRRASSKTSSTATSPTTATSASSSSRPTTPADTSTRFSVNA